MAAPQIGNMALLKGFNNVLWLAVRDGFLQ
jgi:hypothetical protein